MSEIINIKNICNEFLGPRMARIRVRVKIKTHEIKDFYGMLRVRACMHVCVSVSAYVLAYFLAWIMVFDPKNKPHLHLLFLVYTSIPLKSVCVI